MELLIVFSVNIILGMSVETEYYQEFQRVKNMGSQAQLQWNGKREPLTEKYAWAIPTREIVEYVASLSPIVEIGAGNGYWAWEIEQAGGDITCYDKKCDNWKGSWDESWVSVREGTPRDVPEKMRGNTLFLCWPPANSDMAIESVDVLSPDTIIYVGEWPEPIEKDSYVNGSEAFFRELQHQWTLENKLSIPNWNDSTDSLFHFVKEK